VSEDTRTIYRFGEFALDPAETRLTHSGQEIILQPKVFEALLFFVRHPERLLTKQELMEALWPDTFVNEEALTQVIRKLRRALDDNPESPRFIQTVLKHGYRFLPTVEVVQAPAHFSTPPKSMTPAQATAGPQEQTVSPFHRFTLSPPRRVALWMVMTIVGIGLIVSWQAFNSSRREATTPPFSVGTSRVQRMTYFPEREEYGDFSPDGRSFVFVSKHDGGGLFKLYIMRLTGGNPLRLTHSDAEELAPQFSPDGRWIAYTRFEKGTRPSTWMISSQGGQESLLAPDALYADWSPDGRDLAFLRFLPNGELVLIRRTLTDGRERQICTLPGRNFFDTVSWSPDGHKIAFISGEAAWVVPADGGQPRRVAESAESIQCLTWMPDSQSLICDANWGGRANLWLTPLDGSAPVPITLGSDLHRYPAVSGDGKHLLYTSEQWQRVLWVVDEKGQNPRRLATKTTYRFVSVHPNGRWIAYDDNDTGPGDWNLGIVDIEMMGRRNLGSGFYPSFSPDGQRLAFLREQEGSEGLWIVDLATSAERRITRTPGELVGPAWSPDTTRIVFHRAPGAGEPGLIIVDVADGRESFLASGMYGSPAWSPDGRWIAACGRGDQGTGLYLFEVLTGRGRKISDRRSFEAAPIWAADSRSVKVLINERTTPALMTVTLDGTEVSPPMILAFDPDPSFWGIFDVRPLPGRGWIYLLQRVEADLYLLELSP
jgi:Tol biopolymer transport system component/DNA-binding winged helix-turn-helix (wHTH) protein